MPILLSIFFFKSKILCFQCGNDSRNRHNFFFDSAFIILAVSVAIVIKVRTQWVCRYNIYISIFRFLNSENPVFFFWMFSNNKWSSLFGAVIWCRYFVPLFGAVISCRYFVLLFHTVISCRYFVLLFRAVIWYTQLL